MNRGCVNIVLCIYFQYSVESGRGDFEFGNGADEVVLSSLCREIRYDV